MEPQGLTDKVEWEGKRVAAAFDIEEWHQPDEAELIYWGATAREAVLIWELDAEGNASSLMLGDKQTPYETVLNRVPNEFSGVEKWECDPSDSNPHFNEQMARGLYRLGIEDEEVLAELDHPLSAHEKMELRLSMPREFWPQKWLNEEQ